MGRDIPIYLSIYLFASVFSEKWRFADHCPLTGLLARVAY